MNFIEATAPDTAKAIAKLEAAGHPCPHIDRDRLHDPGRLGRARVAEAEAVNIAVCARASTRLPAAVRFISQRADRRCA